MFIFLTLALLSPITAAEDDLNTLDKGSRDQIRYISLYGLSEKEKKEHIACVSFTLNSVSIKRTISKPRVINNTVIRVDLRDYGILPSAYKALGTDYSFKGKELKTLKNLTNCENPIVRANWFVVNAWKAPVYYRLLGVKTLEDFRKRHGYVDDKQAQAALVSRSNLVLGTRMVRRLPTLVGSMWESRDSTQEDYFMNVFSDKFDSVQVLATNKNGLISYFATDNKKLGLDYLNVELAMDHTRLVDGDAVVRVARNCVACHKFGVVPFSNVIKELKKNKIDIIVDKKFAAKLESLFGGEMPIKKDQEDYTKALLLSTGLQPQQFLDAFVAAHRSYYKDMSIDDLAREMRCDAKQLKTWCSNSANAHLLMLLKTGKISRVRAEAIFGELNE